LRGGLYGYVDSAGTEVIAPRFAAASGFNDGAAVVYDGTKAFLIDRKGNEIPGSGLINPDSYFVRHADGSVTTFSPSEYLVTRSGGLFGFGRMSYLPLLPERAEMNSWAFETVIAAIEADLVPVRLQSMYRNNITRAEYASLAVKAMCAILDTDRDALVLERTGKRLTQWIQEYPFSDTADYDVIAAYALDIVQGVGDGRYNPYGQIDRQSAARLLGNAARALGMNTQNMPAHTFADSSDISSWARDDIHFVRAAEIMTGTGEGNFSPRGMYQRQQAFMTVYNLMLALANE
jgi:hypothetical protein